MNKNETTPAALDAAEKAYWKKAVADLKAAGELMQVAQEKLATARTNISGFAQYLKSKYGFDDAIEITPDGEILLAETKNP